MIQQGNPSKPTSRMEWDLMTAPDGKIGVAEKSENQWTSESKSSELVFCYLELDEAAGIDFFLHFFGGYGFLSLLFKSIWFAHMADIWTDELRPSPAQMVDGPLEGCTRVMGIHCVFINQVLFLTLFIWIRCVGMFFGVEYVECSQTCNMWCRTLYLCMRMYIYIYIYIFTVIIINCIYVYIYIFIYIFIYLHMYMQYYGMDIFCVASGSMFQNHDNGTLSLVFRRSMIQTPERRTAAWTTNSWGVNGKFLSTSIFTIASARFPVSENCCFFPDMAWWGLERLIKNIYIHIHI